MDERKKVIIVGCGRQGARLAELLEAEGMKVVLIDINPESFSRVENFKGEKILGSGIDVEVLKKAGIEEAYAFAALTNGDNRNLMSAQIAKDIFNVPIVLCRVYDPRRASIYYDLGLKTVSSTTVGARMLRNLILVPKILRSYQLGNGNALAVEIKIPPELKGKKIKDIELPGEFRVSAVVRDQDPLISDPDFVLKEEDQIFGVVRASAMNKIKKSLGVAEHAYNPL